MKNFTVKARKHHGSRSLDLTIPAEIRESYSVEAGDVFKIEVVGKDSQLVVISYRRMKAV